MKTGGLEWTVMTWNVQGTKPTDVARLAEVIAAESPDVVVLQEARRDHAVALGRTLGMKYTWAFKHHPFTPFFVRRSEGAAILTPHALDAAGHTVVSDATSKRSWRRRIVQWALVGRPDASGYRVYNVHMSPHDLADERRTEAERIAQIITEHGDSPPPIVAGDFNDGGDTSIRTSLPGVEHLSPTPTNPSAAPTQVLDHVLVPANATDVSVTVPAGGPRWAELSDHLPVTVRFTLDWVQGDYG